jgi:hypothetical protein
MSNPPPIRAPAQTGDVDALKQERSDITQKMDIIQKLKKNMNVLKNFAKNTPEVTTAAIKYDKENRDYSTGHPDELETLRIRLNKINDMLRMKGARRKTRRRKTKRRV